MSSHIRNGRGAVRPYLQGPIDLPDFVVDVFGGREVERHDFHAAARHVVMDVQDGRITIEAGELPEGVEPWTGSVYVYVDDVDAVYARALAAGAAPLQAPEDKPYQERQAGFVDRGGNTWWIGTFLG